jgi:sec-independent protein translocase protein TatA
MTQSFADIFGIGTPELIIILVIVLLLFGGKKLPDLARSVGTSVQELRKGVSDGAKAGGKNSTTAGKKSQ